MDIRVYAKKILNQGLEDSFPNSFQTAIPPSELMKKC